LGGGEIRPAAALTGAVAALLSLVGPGAPPASAHGNEVPQRAAITQAPDLPGLEVEVLQSIAPVIQLTNTTQRVVTVLDDTGAPFVRVARDRAEMNRASPFAHRSLDPLGRGSGPRGAGPPEWVVVGGSGVWRWFDPRARLDPGERSRGWSIVLEVDDRRLKVEGRTEEVGLHGHLTASLSGVTPAVPDLEVRVLDGPVPALFVRYPGSSTLGFAGLSGEPFLRIGPDGVWANKRSPTWYMSGAQVIQDVPPEADPYADPAFERVSPQPVWTWLEYRARLPEPDAGYDLGDRPRVVLRWSTPGSVDDAPLAIAGEVRWEPPAPGEGRGRGPGPWWPLGAAAAGAALVVLLVRRRG